MSPGRRHIRSMWGRFIDADLDNLIDGGHPRNQDLAPLRDLVWAMRSLGEEPTEIDRALVADLAVIAATSRPSQHHSDSGARTALRGLRQRVAAVATSVVMVVGTTGVAMASDAAAPGDWNYGIDRALEALGIGAGGEGERLAEIQALAERVEESTDLTPTGVPAPRGDSGPAVHQPGPKSVATDPDQSPAGDTARAILDYLLGGDHPHGPVIADMLGVERGRPESPPGRPDSPNDKSDSPPAQSDEHGPPPDRGRAPSDPPGGGRP